MLPKLPVMLSILAFGLFAAPSAWALGGPVILGGDDLTSHGSVDGSGVSQTGWLYMEKAVGNLKPQVLRTNDNTIAALGSLDPGTVNPGDGGDAGKAIKNAAAKNGMTVNFSEGAAAINATMTSIANGSYNPAIVWI